MAKLVPASEIEEIVGCRRLSEDHVARAVSAEDMVYILHSARCLASGIDLRYCMYSVALDAGIVPEYWPLDEAVVVGVDEDGFLYVLRYA